MTPATISTPIPILRKGRFKILKAKVSERGPESMTGAGLRLSRGLVPRVLRRGRQSHLRQAPLAPVLNW